MHYAGHKTIPRRLGRSLALPIHVRPERARPVLAPLVVLAIVAISGCAHVPVRETVHYADAFDDVASVTEVLLSDYSAAVDALAAQEAGGRRESASYPLRFDPDAALTVEEDDPAIAGFQHALLAVLEYNAVLVDLARGADDVVLGKHAATASKLIESLGLGASPYAAPATELVQTLLPLIAHSRNRHEFTAAVTKGRPAIDAILQGFTEATPDFYRVRVGLAGVAITEIEFDQLSILDEIDRVAGEFAPPTPGTELALRRAQAESDLVALRLAVSPNAPVRPLPVGTRAYDDATQGRIEEHIRVLRGLCNERAASVEGLIRYHELLASYVRLLDDTRGYFDSLLRSLDANGTNEAIATARAVAANARGLHNDMRNARSASLLPRAEAARSADLPQAPARSSSARNPIDR